MDKALVDKVVAVSLVGHGIDRARSHELPVIVMTILSGAPSSMSRGHASAYRFRPNFIAIVHFERWKIHAVRLAGRPTPYQRGELRVRKDGEMRSIAGVGLTDARALAIGEAIEIDVEFVDPERATSDLYGSVIGAAS